MRAGLEGRRVNWIENEAARAGILPGGCHIGSISLKKGPAADLNPLWEVPWPSVEPSEYSPERDAETYGGPPEARLLASIMGHNLCLDYFGPPSKEEEAAGLTVHGEAPVAEWDFGAASGVDADLVSRVELPRANLQVHRTFNLSGRDPVMLVDTEILNLADWDHTFGWQEHATFGPPFVEKGVTLFDASATTGFVDPKELTPWQRLEVGAEFTWPAAPGKDGKPVDLRVFPAVERSEDFTAYLVNGAGEWAWVTAVNPRRRLLCGYLWRAADFPWLGDWEMNHDREAKPWSRRTLTRGMEFGLSPFAHGREGMRALGRLKGVPTLGVIGPHARKTARFYVFLAEVAEDCSGVEAVERKKESISVRLRGTGETIVLSCR